VVLIDPLTPDKPKTAELRNYLKSIELGGAKVLILTDGTKPNVHLSARNMPNVEVRKFGDESVYDILWANVVVIERSAIDALAAGAADEGEEAADA
jgi:large subunit ribosomal protein L4